MDKEEFYLVSDNDYLVSVIEQELAFVKNNWSSPGRPTIMIMLTKEMMLGTRTAHSQNEMLDSQRRPPEPTVNTTRNLLNFFMSLRSGSVNNVRVRLGRLNEMINTACIESLDFLASGLGNDGDWHDVLKGQTTSPNEVKKLYLSENATKATSAPGGRERKKTTRRNFSHESIQASSNSQLLTNRDTYFKSALVEANNNLRRDSTKRSSLIAAKLRRKDVSWPQ
ncbi:hypothetical protein SeLEV6574_g06168 [Synchytrium endobioticum]|uniref:Uncharacterized protein n=1 Tax=Synchytrium endobioticum TaxID=286115 RepID=A0A507CQ79_9FUNG|nr:hypothetical protein SeLEV6574_g06168 [Synchytrium endobioticum]